MEELSKSYNPQEVEQKWYKYWEENNLFSPDDNSSAESFVIVIPPPNVTGSLHMGHALDNSLQDILIRFKRMCGFKALWIPGTDHAGIATQNVVERELKKEGKRKEGLGREAFLEKVWSWKKEYGGRITMQLRRLGASCDWKRERFTMDEGLSKAVTKEFVSLHNEGLIYRGKRIINWCPRCETALSDIETEYQNKKGKLYYIKYPVAEDLGRFVVVATTRPETMLGDTAVAINPKDERYKTLLGKDLVLPLLGRKIPVIKDDFVDPAFGTGAVKVTPAHDPNDYEMGERHNLPKINILTKNGNITFAELNEKETKDISPLSGLDRYKAREALVKILEDAGFIEKIEDYDNSVGHCYRCKTSIEPYLSDQWFVRVKPLAEKAIEVVEKEKIRFYPERWTKVYLQWMTNLKDWCISRQLWWGHRIPAWTCKKCGEIIVSETAPKSCSKCSSSDLIQDPDVFDTWFSSALWPFSTLGWPDETKDFKKYYPTSVLITGYDIITFWVSRMIMTGVHFTKKAPFHTVFIHGLIRDISGKKMSKSLGNVIDPLDVINNAGADALRFALVSLVTGGGQDIKLAEEKITEAKNFANKIWNVSRFVMMTCSDFSPSKKINDLPLALADLWILSRFNRTIKETTELIEALKIGDAAKLLYEFIWSEFCDWYIEMSKNSLYGENKTPKETSQAVLMHVLDGILKILHPFMPFETEEIYQKLNSKGEISDPKNSIMVQPWPVFDESLISEEAEDRMSFVVGFIRGLRNTKANLSIQNNKEIKIITNYKFKEDEERYIKALLKVSEISDASKIPPHSVMLEFSGSKFYLPIDGLVDFEKESEKIKKEESKLRLEIEKVEKRLSNEEFTKNATEGSIEREKTKLSEYSAKIKLFESYLGALS